MPELQTDDTVRAFSGTLRRISGGVDVFSVDLSTLSATAKEAILVEDLIVPLLIVRFEAGVVWIESVLIASIENP